MSFLSILHTIEDDVLKGIAAAEPIVATFVPAAAPILAEIASIIAALETIGAPATTNVSPIVQAIATVSTVKQHAAASGGAA